MKVSPLTLINWLGSSQFFRRQVKRYHLVLKAMRFVSTIAKRLVGTVPTTAKRNNGAALKSVSIALRVNDFEVAVHLDGAVVVDCDFRFFHTDLVCFCCAKMVF